MYFAINSILIAFAVCMIKIYMGKILVFQICKLQIYPGKTFFIIFFWTIFKSMTDILIFMSSKVKKLYDFIHSFPSISIIYGSAIKTSQTT